MIPNEENLIVDKIKADAAQPNENIEDDHAMGSNWKSKMCYVLAGLDEMEPMISSNLCDPIRETFFWDPVIVQSGINYNERPVLEDDTSMMRTLSAIPSPRILMHPEVCFRLF